MRRMMVEFSRIMPLAALLAALLAPAPARAAFTVTFAQAGNNVVATGTGSLNLTGVLDDGLSTIAGSVIRPGVGYIKLGDVDFERLYRPFFSTNAGFGADVYNENATGTGYHVGIYALNNYMYLSASYVSGTQFTSTATFANTTIAGLGLTTGTFAYNYSATRGGPTLDTFTIQVGPAGTVPEPASALMCVIAGAGGIALRMARRRRAR